MTIYLNNHSDRQCMRTLIPPQLTNKSLGCWLSTSLSWRCFGDTCDSFRPMLDISKYFEKLDTY